MKRVCVVGNFGVAGVKPSDGQTVKTQTLYRALVKKYGSENVTCFNTYGGALALLKWMFQSWWLLMTCRNVIVLPAQRALPIVVPLLFVENLLFRRTLHYDVIGGWLSSYLKNRALLTAVLKHWNHIYVETTTLQSKLHEMEFQNVQVVPNGKDLIPLERVPARDYTLPLRLIFLARVNREKGLEDAVQSVRKVNDMFDSPRYVLDVYGKVEDDGWFDEMRHLFSPQIAYKGVLESDKTVESLSSYDLMIFPTRYETEGVPGSIIDAYMAGLPVIASRWESFSDVVDEKMTGYGYRLGDVEDLITVLLNVVENVDKLTNMSQLALQKACQYTEKQMIEIISNYL